MKKYLILTILLFITLFSQLTLAQSQTTKPDRWLNTFYGVNAGKSNTRGADNAFFGYAAGKSNTTGLYNSFFGFMVGDSNKGGNSNSFFGSLAGSKNTFGEFNVFIGGTAGSKNTIGSYNTAIGMFTNVGSENLKFATAIGADAIVTSNNTIQLGRDKKDTVRIGKTGSNGLTLLCLNKSKEISNCSASNSIESLKQTIKKQQAEIEALIAIVCAQNKTANICLPKR